MRTFVHVLLGHEVTRPEVVVIHVQHGQKLRGRYACLLRPVLGCTLTASDITTAPAAIAL